MGLSSVEMNSMFHKVDSSLVKGCILVGRLKSQFEG